MNGNETLRILRDAPVTLAVSVVAAVTSLMYWQQHDMRWMVLDPGTLEAQPWRALTTTLLHGGMVHLAFNLMWMWNLGVALERAWGPVRYLGTIAMLGAAGSLAQYAVSGAGVGLSGVVYGLFGLIYFAQRVTPALANVVPPSVTRVFVVWFFVCIALTLGGTLAVANTAHAAGAVLGGLLGRAILARRLREPAAPAWWAAFVLALAALAVGAVQVPRVFRTASGIAADERRAMDLLGAGRRDEAVVVLEGLVKEDPGNARLWHNLAYSYQELGRPEEMLVALRSGWKVSDAELKEEFARMLGLALAGRAMELEAAGDYGPAIDALREAITLQPKLEESLCMIGGWLAEGTGDLDAAVHWYRMGARNPDTRERAMAALRRLGAVSPEEPADHAGEPTPEATPDATPEATPPAPPQPSPGTP